MRAQVSRIHGRRGPRGRSGVAGPRLVRALITGLLLTLGLLRPTPEAAAKTRPAKAGAPAADQTAQALLAARAALLAGDLATAQKRAEQALRETAAAESLYLLGRLAEAQAQTLPAHDFMRRYLAAPDLDLSADSDDQAQARRVLDSPRPPAASLYVTGDRGTLVLLDRRPVAVLPLSRPLLIAPGEHALVLQRDATQTDARRQTVLEDSIRVPVARLGEVRADFASRALVLTILPGVLLVEDGPGSGPALSGKLPGKLPGKLSATIEDVLVRRRLSAIRLDDAQTCGDEPAPSRCDDALLCQAALARHCEADHVLHVRAGSPADAAQSLSLSLVDVATAEVAAEEALVCPGCGEEQQLALLRERLPPLLDRAWGRGRGQLHLESSPPGASVRIDGRERGTTPFSGPLLAGRHRIEVGLDGWGSQSDEVQIADGGDTRLSLTLPSLEPPPAALRLPPPPPPPPPRRRPLWRVVGGASLIGAGLVLGGFGVAALAVDGTQVQTQCGDDASTERLCTFRTRDLGLGLLLPGLSLSLAGAVLWGLPPGSAKQGVPR